MSRRSRCNNRFLKIFSCHPTLRRLPVGWRATGRFRQRVSRSCSRWHNCRRPVPAGYRVDTRRGWESIRRINAWRTPEAANCKGSCITKCSSLPASEAGHALSLRTGSRVLANSRTITRGVNVKLQPPRHRMISASLLLLCKRILASYGTHVPIA